MLPLVIGICVCLFECVPTSKGVCDKKSLRATSIEGLITNQSLILRRHQLCLSWPRLMCNKRLKKKYQSSVYMNVFVSSTSSCMPHSNSMVTQASMGKAISLPLIFRCSSRDLPNDGFSTHASATQTAA